VIAAEWASPPRNAREPTMPTDNDFQHWQSEHRIVLQNQLDPASSWGGSIGELVLPPLAMFLVVRALAHLLG
jgi:hypothetical protein